MKKNTRVAHIDSLWFALLAFGGFGLEFVLLAMEPNDQPVYVHHILTSIVWCAVAIALWQFSKQKLAFDIFEATKQPSKKILLATLVIVIATVGSVTLLWGGFKPLIEYKHLGSLANFIWQYIYYLFEAVLIFVTISFGQKFGDGVFKRTSIPWGGLILAFTWGLVHVLTQDLLTGLVTFMWSIVYGIVYVLCQKNYVYSLPAIAIMFII